MIAFDYSQLPLGERRYLCRRRLLMILDGEWVDIKELEPVYLKYHRKGRYPSETHRRFSMFLLAMEDRKLIMCKTLGNSDIVTHVRKVKHPPGITRWRPRRMPRSDESDL